MRFAGRPCFIPFTAALVLLGSSAACGNDSSGAAPAGLPEPSVDSSDTRAHRLTALVERGDTLSTLARALRRAGLAEELRRGGPYTLFAPTDHAFRRHWPGFDSLLAQTNALPAARSSPQTGERDPGEEGNHARDSLRQVLQFHLVRGHFAAANLADALRLSTLSGKPLTLARAPRNSARLHVQQDAPGPVPVRRTVEAQNGVIHLLPRPLRPSPPDTSARGALRSSGSATGGSPAPISN